MPDVRITRKGIGELAVEAPFNTLFIAEARRLYGRWREGQWWFDWSEVDRVRLALREIYGTDGESDLDTVTVRVTWEIGAEVVRDGVTVGGRLVARAHPNGDDVTLGDDVHLEAGLFFAGADGRKWSTRVRYGTVVLMRDFPRALVGRPRSNAGNPIVTIVDDPVVPSDPVKVHRTDEWILGEGCDSSSRYLVHTAAPRFVCRVSASDDVPEHYLAGPTAELASGAVLHSFLWMEDPPPEAALRDLIAEAELAIIRESMKGTLDE